MKCHWPDGVCPTPNACEQMGDCAAKERGLIDDRDPRDAEIDRLRGLLRRGFAFSANCEADPEQPQAFREKAIAWQNEVASAIDGTADQPPAGRVRHSIRCATYQGPSAPSLPDSQCDCGAADKSNSVTSPAKGG